MISVSLNRYSVLAKSLFITTTTHDLGIGIRNVNFHVVRIIHKRLLLDSKVETIHLTTASLSGGGCPGCPGASTFGTASP